MNPKLKAEIQNLPIHSKKVIIRDLLKDTLGISSLLHLTLSHNFWTIITWNKDEVPYLQHNRKINETIDKLISEMANTDRKTTLKPEQIQLINGLSKQPKIISYQNKIENILTNPGMSEMSKRSVGLSASTNSHHAIGIGTTAESLNDITLENEVGRKEIGTRTVANQTERYGSAFSFADVGSINRSITEAGMLTANVGGILVLRITSDPQPITGDRLVTVQTNISHQNGVEI